MQLFLIRNILVGTDPDPYLLNMDPDPTGTHFCRGKKSKLFFLIFQLFLKYRYFLYLMLKSKFFHEILS